MKNQSNKTRHNAAIVIRFLKETKLLPYWKAYLNSDIHKSTHDTTAHWANKQNIPNVFGETRFTYFLNKNGIFLKRGRYTYSLLNAFLQIFYPKECFDLEEAYKGKEALRYNKIDKTIRVILENGEIWDGDILSRLKT